MTREIVTRHVYPPIPIRQFDWCAHYDGEEEAGGYGYGRTEAEAVADFNENYREMHDERLAPIWPTHEDGTNKRVGDMTDDERKAVMVAAKKRFFEGANA